MISQSLEKEGILDMARGNAHFQQHAQGYIAFKRLLCCSDDRNLPLVEKVCDSMGFRDANRLRVVGPERQLLFCAASRLRIMKKVTGVKQIRAKKPD